MKDYIEERAVALANYILKIKRPYEIQQKNLIFLKVLYIWM